MRAQKPGQHRPAKNKNALKISLRVETRTA
jgi:hypothetical protein